MNPLHVFWTQHSSLTMLSANFSTSTIFSLSFKGTWWNVFRIWTWTLTVYIVRVGSMPNILQFVSVFAFCIGIASLLCLVFWYLSCLNILFTDVQLCYSTQVGTKRLRTEMDHLPKHFFDLMTQSSIYLVPNSAKCCNKWFMKVQSGTHTSHLAVWRHTIFTRCLPSTVRR